jgi:RHS repeat-associated protein
MFSSGGYQYGYAPGNKRVWKAVCCDSSNNPIEEITFWSVTGQKLATYQLVSTPVQMVPTTIPPVLSANQTGTNYYFGSKLIKNAGGYVGADRLGSIGKFYPYGQERPSATTNGTEKFTGYLRDAETGLDYADQRFHNPGTGRFLTADSSSKGIDARSPGTWNRYAYVLGDPINHADPKGTDCATYASYDSSGNLTASEDWGCTQVGYVGPAATGYGGNDFWSNTAAQFQSGISSAQAAGAEIAAQVATFLPALQHFADTWQQTTDQARQTGSAALANLGPDCKQLFAASPSGSNGESLLSLLSSDNDSQVFFNTFGASQGNLSLGSVVGNNSILGNMLISNFCPTAIACVAVGGPQTPVLLNGAYYAESAADQQVTILHELLHIVTGLDDDGVVQAFGINIPKGPGWNSSNAFSNWLKNDCKND